MHDDRGIEHLDDLRSDVVAGDDHPAPIRLVGMLDQGDDAEEARFPGQFRQLHHLGIGTQPGRADYHYLWVLQAVVAQDFTVLGPEVRKRGGAEARVVAQCIDPDLHRQRFAGRIGIHRWQGSHFHRWGGARCDGQAGCGQQQGHALPEQSLRKQESLRNRKHALLAAQERGG